LTTLHYCVCFLIVWSLCFDSAFTFAFVIVVFHRNWWRCHYTSARQSISRSAAGDCQNV